MTDMTKRWTPEEDAIIHAHYVRLGTIGMFDSGLLQGRTKKAIRDRARTIGAKSGIPKGRAPKKKDVKNGEGIARVASVWDLGKR